MVILTYNWTAFTVDVTGKRTEEWGSYQEAKTRYAHLIERNVEFVFEIDAGYMYVPTVEEGNAVIKVIRAKDGKVIG